MKPAIILDPYGRRKKDIFTPDDLRRLHSMAQVIWGRDEQMPASAIRKVRRHIVAVVSGDWRHGAVDSFPKLKAILEVSGRLPLPETLDYKACFRRGIRVLSCSPAFAPAVAELALSEVLSLARGITAGDRLMRSGAWKYNGKQSTFSLYGQPVGLIGFGRIARCLQALLAPFRCPIQVYDPWLSKRYLERQNVTPVVLDKLLRTSRIIFVLASPTPNNESMLDRRRLRLIRSDAVFALVSRASLVDFNALTELLAAGRFKAAIDVFPNEPLEESHPIRTFENVVLTPHWAGSVGRINIGQLVVNDLEAILAGLPPNEMLLAQPEIIGKLTTGGKK